MSGIFFRLDKPEQQYQEKHHANKLGNTYAETLDFAYKTIVHSARLTDEKSPALTQGNDKKNS